MYIHTQVHANLIGTHAYTFKEKVTVANVILLQILARCSLPRESGIHIPVNFLLNSVWKKILCATVIWKILRIEETQWV